MRGKTARLLRKYARSIDVDTKEGERIIKSIWKGMTGQEKKTFRSQALTSIKNKSRPKEN